MTRLTQRAQYRPSGLVDWFRFAPLAILVLIAAAVIAEALNLLTDAGWYLIFLAPLLAAMAVVAVLWKAIRIGHCRSPVAAMLVGILAGITLYLGYFYCGMVSELGPQAALRPDLLPEYIRFRMENEVTEDVGHPSYQNEKKPVPALNWFQFAFEFGLVLFLIPFLGYRLASRPYCERCRDWKHQAVVRFPPGSGIAIARLLDEGRIVSLFAAGPVIQTNGKKFTTIALESCPGKPIPQGCAAYLAVKDVYSGTTISPFQQLDGAWGKWRVRRVELTEAEFAALKPAFVG